MEASSRRAIPAAAAGPPDPALVRTLTSVMADSRVQQASSAAVVLDARSGAVLYDRSGDRALIPASNTKSLTAAAALHTLGPAHRFTTEVFRRGKVVGGAVLPDAAKAKIHAGMTKPEGV